MTLAPPMAAVAGWIMLGETLGWKAILAMAVTLLGIAISILSRDGGSHHVKLDLPLKGVLLGIGAGIGQGVGLVLSKIGMQYYAAAVPAGPPPATRISVSATTGMSRSISCIVFITAVQQVTYIQPFKTRTAVSIRNCRFLLPACR